MRTIKFQLFLLAAVIAFAAAGCHKDEHVPPDVSFKTGAGYTSDDATVSAGDTVLVGIVADKTEDELKTFNVSYAYDGGSSTTALNQDISADGDHFETDYPIVTRMVAGTEVWSFTITDRDGNITTETITLTVM